MKRKRNSFSQHLHHGVYITLHNTHANQWSPLKSMQMLNQGSLIHSASLASCYDAQAFFSKPKKGLFDVFHSSGILYYFLTKCGLLKYSFWIFFRSLARSLTHTKKKLINIINLYGISNEEEEKRKGWEWWWWNLSLTQATGLSLWERWRVQLWYCNHYHLHTHTAFFLRKIQREKKLRQEGNPFDSLCIAVFFLLAVALAALSLSHTQTLLIRIDWEWKIEGGEELHFQSSPSSCCECVREGWWWWWENEEEGRQKNNQDFFIEIVPHPFSSVRIEVFGCLYQWWGILRSYECMHRWFGMGWMLKFI